MEDQNASVSRKEIFRKRFAIIQRGTLRGIIGGALVGIMLNIIDGLFQVFSSVSQSGSDLNFLVSVFTGTVLDPEMIVALGLPVGFVIGLNTGIIAVIFGHNCPKLPVWSALSWLGVITGLCLGLFPFYGWPFYDLRSYTFFVGIALMSFTAGWMAYQVTISEIKKGVLKEVSRTYTLLSGLTNLLLTILMLFPYFYLMSMST